MNNRQQILLALALIVELALPSALSIGDRDATVQARTAPLPSAPAVLPYAFGLERTDTGVGLQPAEDAADGLGVSSPFSHSSSAGTRAVLEPLPDHDWYTETVNTEGNVGKYSSLALDEFGRPHISYYNVTNGDLEYAWHTGIAWLTETVDTEGDVGRYTSLALDKLGHPHISYRDTTNRALKYAWHTGTAWLTETVDAGGDWGYGTSLALDDLGYPRISYHSWNTLKYAKYTGTTWETEVVDSRSNMRWADTSLALDGSGRPHISYSAGESLIYAQHDGSTWQIEFIYSGWGCQEGMYNSLALDTHGRPHIAHRGDNPCGSLFYSWYDGANWHSDYITGGGTPTGVSLALDGLDHPHIASSQWFDMVRLLHVWRDETGWQVETLDGQGTNGCCTSIALSKEGRRPHISYYDSNYDSPDGTLKYAYLEYTQPPHPRLLEKRAHPIDDVQNGDHITYTFTLSGSIASAQLWDPLPGSIQYVTDSITSTLSPPAIYSPTAHAIVWQGMLVSDTVQTVRFQVTPITGTPGKIVPPIVNTATLTDLTYDKHSLATAIVNGYHLYLPLLIRQSPDP